jgi:hypothetical protein
MKKILFALSVLVFIACKSSAKKVEKSVENLTESSSIEQRLTAYMKLNDEMKLEELMDYIYPKLFSIVPKEQLIKAMKDGFDNEELTVELDSLKIEKIYPVFEMGKGSFAKVDYSMVIVMKYKTEAGSTDKASHLKQMARIAESMEGQYGSGNVKVDENGVIRIWEKNKLVAVKDEYAKDWSFVSLKDEDPMMNKLFSKEVLDKLISSN